jgi:hypothetical protein
LSMNAERFQLSRDELARQLHQAAREAYPELRLEGKLIHILLIEQIPAGSSFVFPAREYALKNNIPPEEFLRKLYYELSIEYEKNLHDKYFFEMHRDDDCIYFSLIDTDRINER